MNSNLLAAIHIALLSIRDSGPVHTDTGICTNVVVQLIEGECFGEAYEYLKKDVYFWLDQQFKQWPKHGNRNYNFPVPNYFADKNKWNNTLRLELLNWLIERIETGATE